MQINVVGEQRAILEPEPVRTGKIAVDTEQFEMPPAIIMPETLNSATACHLIFAEQPSGFAPLTAKTVQKTTLVGFLGHELPVLVPSSGKTMPASTPQADFFADLSVSIELTLADSLHKTRIGRRRTPALFCFIKARPQSDGNPALEWLPENRRGANSTHPHERDREAPMREARQAAPDWARASAALSSSESSRFSRGTEPLRRKSC